MLDNLNLSKDLQEKIKQLEKIKEEIRDKNMDNNNKKQYIQNFNKIFEEIMNDPEISYDIKLSLNYLKLMNSGLMLTYSS